MREQKSPIEIVVKKGEPWVELASGSDLSGWARNEQIQYNQMYRQAENVQFFRKTFDFLTDNGIAGDYFEFGCHRGRTFRMALSEARRQNRDAMHFLAFDS